MDFDYIVVGAGAAGCALASRLSQDRSVAVLLLEAGSRNWADHVGRIPRALPLILRSDLLTSYPTLPIARTGEPDYWVRGRGVGGSTLVNGMMYLRGEPAAYDDLAAAVGPGWGWTDFRAAYEELESRFIHPSRSSLSGLDRIILDAIESTGVDIVDDLNGSPGPRAGATPASISAGRRTSAAVFVAPARHRANLRVLRGTTAEALVWQGTRVVGVLARRRNDRREIRARTVVLCAGTIETPLLLERSGIGSPAVLHTAGIPLRVENPNVGERVREQRGQGLQVRLRRSVDDADEVSSRRAQASQAARYLVSRGGALARPAYDVCALLSSQPPAVRSAGPSDARSGSAGPASDSEVDIQVMAAPFALAPGDVLQPAGYPGVLFSGYPLRPDTLSRIHVDPAAPGGPPIITARYAETSQDQRAQDATLAALRRLAYSGPLGDLIAGEDHAGPGSPGTAVYHAVGSAAMGPNDDDVVDPALRVRGTDGLRVADLSILPFHPSGGTAAPAMAVGWLAGALLIAERG